MTEKEFIHTANDLKNVVDENLIMFVLVDGKEAGFIVCLPISIKYLKRSPTENYFQPAYLNYYVLKNILIE